MRVHFCTAFDEALNTIDADVPDAIARLKAVRAAYGTDNYLIVMNVELNPSEYKLLLLLALGEK